VGLDGRERKFPWPDAGGLDRDQCGPVLVSSIRIFRNKDFLIHWIQALYVRIGRICGGRLPPMPLHIFVSRDHSDKGKIYCVPNAALMKHLSE
jgi:hypothetical protein